MAEGINNYVLGKGKVFFSRYDQDKKPIGGERFIGNCPEFNLTSSSDKLDHFSSTGGLKIKDASVTLQVNRSGGFVTDNIDADNLSLFFTGEKATIATTSQTGATTTVIARKDQYYQLGQTAANPSGVRKVSNVVLKLTASPQTIIPASDYTVDLALGRVYIKPTATITEGQQYTFTFDVATSTASRVISKSQSVYGAIRFIADNPQGQNQDYFLPLVELSPDGDYNLISDDWTQIGFTMEALKLDDNTESIYIDGRPA